MSRFCRFWDSVLVETIHVAMTGSQRYKFDTRRFKFVPGFGWFPSPHYGVFEDLDLVEHLASGFTSLEVFVALAGLVERECLVDCHLVCILKMCVNVHIKCEYVYLYICMHMCTYIYLNVLSIATWYVHVNVHVSM